MMAPEFSEANFSSPVREAIGNDRKCEERGEFADCRRRSPRWLRGMELRAITPPANFLMGAVAISRENFLRTKK